jgi:nitrite reductase/ring-hydroxylating ferredoxin subunit
MQHLLAKMDELSADKVTRVDFFGRPAIVYKEGEKAVAAIDVCMHLGGPLELNGGQLQCQWHGACFALDTGKTVSGPAPPQSKLVRLPTRVKDGGVYYVVGE